MSSAEDETSISTCKSLENELSVFQDTENNLARTIDEKERLELMKWLGQKAYYYSNKCPSNERKKWLEKAYNHLKSAHQLDPEDNNVVRSLAAATGRLAEESDVRSKIRLGYEFKDYLDKAIATDSETDPEHTFELCHMRGRLAYTVLTLPLIERLVAKTFGVLPQFTVEGAMDDLKKAALLQPDVAENELFVAKCLILKGDYEEAVQYLQKAAACSTDVAIEQEYVNEAKKLLNNLLSK